MVLSSLEQAAYDNCVELLEYNLPVDGMYYATRDYATITLSTRLETSNARNCALARGLGYHFSAPPNLLDAPAKLRRIYDRAAFGWAAKQLVPLQRIVDAWQAGIRDEWELADYLNVTPKFLEDAIDYLRHKHGLYVRHGNMCIWLKPIFVRYTCKECAYLSKCRH